jgi:hypothetical protein
MTAVFSPLSERLFVVVWDVVLFLLHPTSFKHEDGLLEKCLYDRNKYQLRTNVPKSTYANFYGPRSYSNSHLTRKVPMNDTY